MLSCSQKTGSTGADAIRRRLHIRRNMECIESKKCLLTQIVRMHQRNAKAEILDTAKSFKEELQKDTRQLRHITAEKTKDGEGRECMDNFHVI
jgi:hypothetical protein